MIITRFPPSPTGYLHVGGARTALFNWLYARHMKGNFILRIEDTDLKRSAKSSVDAIFEALEWLGIDWDEGPFFQSRRFDIYQQYIMKLLDSGYAYYCICSQEKIDTMRKEAMVAGGKPKYDGTCRDKGLAKTGNAVIRFRAPATGTTIVKDIIKGSIVFQNSEQDDFIICRSDGTPTYNFVVVVDDITMGINTVIRGDDHLNNTPRQIMLYNALKSPLPAFGHVPMVLGKDRTRLSKRHGAMSVTAYRDMGYLPDALINYLVRLGWSYGNQEFFSRDELIEKFTLQNIGKSPGIFDQEKLLALNADHIKTASPRNLSSHLLPFLKERGCMVEKGDFLDSVIKTLNTRSKTLIDMADGALFYFQESVLYEEKAAKKFLKQASIEALKQLIDQLEPLESFNENSLENAFKKVMETTGLKLGKIAQPARVALTGKTVSPGIFEIIEVLGKKRVILRMQNAVQFIKDRKD
ncbi:MAG: glutamate--tRNA ligase [Desulfobacterales bacterium]|uniref:Glutamate--tRNA ligase n=1 Tax=Candidatus Desulfaltia bathyphila TaxID=2841697 RepID=A0A8J6T860_9BACT|nr:glutamate--tRNA ligase [Candidatus Desulfaltia bathyphila]MBL7194927.1 glutamate--tRNA ligase [Desulfobacterales bacterium]MBL7207492.1 glutamate--tRNA ligase [Desulfobacterales bacterium]